MKMKTHYRQSKLKLIARVLVFVVKAKTTNQTKQNRMRERGEKIVFFDFRTRREIKPLVLFKSNKLEKKIVKVGQIFFTLITTNQVWSKHRKKENNLAMIQCLGKRAFAKLISFHLSLYLFLVENYFSLMSTVGLILRIKLFQIHTDMRTVSPDNRGKLVVSRHYPTCS